MKCFSLLLFTYLVLLTGACHGTKQLDAASTTLEKDMLTKGYQKGILVSDGEESPCPFLISIETDQSYMLDPLNIDAFSEVHSDSIWVKYIPLRQKSRCPNTLPVQIEDLKKREE